MNDARKTDALLRRALGGVEAPDQALLRQVKASLRKEQDMKTNKTTKRVLTLALAAALVLALSVTAWAVYMASVEDYIIEPPAGLEVAVGTWISWNGYQGTPEYAASVEWNDWYVANADDMVAETGNAPVDSPYANYGDYTDWGRKELEGIAAKYGVRLHTAMASGYAEDIYEVLGTEPFLPEDSGGSGYVYEDGSFKLEGVDGVVEDGQCTVFAGVKGAITGGSGGADLSGGYEEWQYMTGGQTMDLVLANGRGVMLLETPGAYIYADVENVPDREALEAAADKIGFDVLAERFDGSGHPETAEGIEALEARNAQGTAGYQDFEDIDTFRPLSKEELDGLGRWGIGALTEDFADHLYWSEVSQEVIGIYSRDNRQYQLQYSRLAADEQQAYMDMRRSLLDDPERPGSTEDCDVNGMPGILDLDKENPGGGIYGGSVLWCDPAAEVQFLLSVSVSQTYGQPITAEDLLALAGSVALAE